MKLNKVICENCPLRLFNPDNKVCMKGVGDVYSDKLIVLPYIDKKAFKHHGIDSGILFEDVKEVLDSSTGGCMEANYYITSLIKCKESYKLDMTDDIVSRCSMHLYNEISQLRPKYVFLFGNAVNRLLKGSIEENINRINIFGRTAYFSNYNPSIHRYNTDKTDVVRNVFIKHLKAINYNEFSDYEIIKY
jgi:hypothetical protein